MIRNRWLSATFLAWTLAAPVASAAEDPAAAIRACRGEPDAARRLACYDREVDRHVGEAQSTASPPATVPAAAPAAPVLSAEEKFGRRGDMQREEIDRKKQESRGLEELVAMVTEIARRADGLMVMTLDNGQVWAQNRPDTAFRVKVGEQVRIEPALMGSFLMIGSAKRSTRVTRIK